MNPFTEVVVHTHPDDILYALFSGPDIIKMEEVVYYTTSGFKHVVNHKDVTHILIAENRTFALRFDDEQSALKLRDIYLNKDIQKEFIKELHDDYDDDNTGHPLYQSTTDIFKQIDHLYNLFEAYEINMSLYEANYDSNNRITTWDKIENDD